MIIAKYLKRSALLIAAMFASSPLWAQTRIITLGTQGGPLVSLERSQPANAVIVGQRVYLVDAGNGVTRQLTAAGLAAARVDHIFITHNHDDHNADWGTLMGLAWSTGRRDDIHIWGPGGTESMMAGFLQFFEPNARIRMADSEGLRAPREMFKAHDYPGPGVVFEDDSVTVSVAENCHYHPAQAADLRKDDKSYAVRFQTADKVVVFSGDTGVCPALVDFVKGADILFHEVIDLQAIEKVLNRGLPPALAKSLYRHMVEDHTTAEDVGKLASLAKVKEVVLTHFVPGRDESEADCIEGVRKHFKGSVRAARDLMSF